MVQASGGVKPYLRIALIAHTPTMLGHSLKSVGNSNTHRTALQSTVRCSFLPQHSNHLLPEPELKNLTPMSLNVHFLVIGRDYRYLSISVLLQLIASHQRISTPRATILVDEVQTYTAG